MERGANKGERKTKIETNHKQKFAGRENHPAIFFFLANMKQNKIQIFTTNLHDFFFFVLRYHK